MTDSILTTIKKMLGISEEYEHFDIDIITHINSTFSILAQLGVGPDKGFSVHDKTEKWSDYMPENATLEMVKTYVQIKVRLIILADIPFQGCFHYGRSARRPYFLVSQQHHRLSGFRDLQII